MTNATEIRDNTAQNDQTECSSIWDDIVMKVVETIKTKSDCSCYIEIDTYFDEPLIDRKSNNLLLWWNMKKHM
ncbi:Uncharacterized protein OBRU01_16986 [Operophtera brumata]|uniref:Uncharacterized protein n=1 Tax=Operophtera brumata TaxID=104452 RepID=A0A0L7L1T2_OPEBR|nr:Uncharacterized protein OBRU01_16986 [Operophtera brumata]